MKSFADTFVRWFTTFVVITGSLALFSYKPVVVVHQCAWLHINSELPTMILAPANTPKSLAETDTVKLTQSGIASHDSVAIDPQPGDLEQTN